MNLLAESIESSRDAVTETESLASFSDADLLEAWTRDQENHALAALVHRYSRMVLSVCRRRCRSETDAEDAFQTTFLYLARNARKIRHPDRLAGWLHRVAQRAAVATLKQAKRETEPMVDPPATDDPLDRLTRRHEAIVLDEELADLPEHYRAAIVMHLYEGLTIDRLAERFDTSVGSVRGRLQRGKRLLAQRLRRRGIVPLLAFASANACTVPTSQSARAAEAVIQVTDDSNLPEPPINTPLLESLLVESLLVQGAFVMPTMYTAAALLGGSTLVALMMLPLGTNDSVTSGSSGQVSLTAEPKPMVPEINSPLADQDELAQMAAGDGSSSAATEPGPQGMTAGAGMMGQFPGPGPASWSGQPVVPQPSSPTAARVTEALDQLYDFDVAAPLRELPGVLRELADVPVLIDRRGVDFATRHAGPEVLIEFQDSSVPLRSALREMLGPHGLKGIVEDEGLVITADPGALVHRGIGVSRWINLDEDVYERISVMLDEPATLEFVELPLSEAIEHVADQFGLPVRIDRRSLEEIGIGDEPITANLSNIRLRSALAVMLDDLDLTYTIRDESLVITTHEAAEQRLLNRIYWLEGTGFAHQDFQSVVELVQSSIVPDTWEALGGPSTMSPVRNARPAILVSTTFDVHGRIAKLLESLRESHFGPDPVLQPVAVPPAQPGFGAGMGGMGGGGFF